MPVRLWESGSQACADHPTSTSTPHLPPNLTSLVTSAPDLLKKITLGSLQGPTEDHVKLLHLLQCRQGGKNAEDWQLFEGVEGEGV